jgi:hypothetical protein
MAAVAVMTDATRAGLLALFVKHDVYGVWTRQLSAEEWTAFLDALVAFVVAERANERKVCAGLFAELGSEWARARSREPFGRP